MRSLWLLPLAVALQGCSSTPPPQAPAPEPQPEVECHALPETCAERMAERCNGKGHILSETTDDRGFITRFRCDPDWATPNATGPSETASGPSAGELILRGLAGAAAGAQAGLNASSPPSSKLGTDCYADAECGAGLRCAKGWNKNRGVCAER